MSSQNHTIMFGRKGTNMKDFDLNIWDRIGYETSYAEEGWAITVYEIPSEGAPYGSGKMLATLDLTEEEAKMLTLGVHKADGGDYAPDEDFWLDIESFFLVYSNIPTRVKAFLTSLYEGKVENDGLLSLWQELSTSRG